MRVFRISFHSSVGLLVASVGILVIDNIFTVVTLAGDLSWRSTSPMGSTRSSSLLYFRSIGWQSYLVTIICEQLSYSHLRGQSSFNHLHLALIWESTSTSSTNNSTLYLKLARLVQPLAQSRHELWHNLWHNLGTTSVQHSTRAPESILLTINVTSTTWAFRRVPTRPISDEWQLTFSERRTLPPPPPPWA